MFLITTIIKPMLKTVSMILGFVFVLVGVAGFLGGFGIVGPTGIFMTDTLHDVVHLVIGAIILLVAFTSTSSLPMWLKIFGALYLVLAVLGLLSTDGSILGLVMANRADVYLHVVLGVVLLAVPYMFRNDNM